jgi:Zn-dependent protease/predicted transcriptional regulator
MRWSWKIAEIAGIGIFIHATFFLLILFILFRHLSSGQGWMAGLAGVAFILAIFACVVLHELGHALTARRFGILTRDITLLPIGGLARLERMPEKPSQELWVAAAGPAVNVVIAGILYLTLTTFGDRPDLLKLEWVGGGFLNKLMAVNLWLALFNMLPAFPMDGGRVLRALLAQRMQYTRATQIAARVGQMMAFFFGMAGLFTNPFLLFIALFVWMGAEQEAALVQMRSSLGGIPVAQVMLRDYRTLNPDDTLGVAIEHILAGWQQDFPVVFGDHVLGVLTREDLLRALAQQGMEMHVRDAMRREVPSVDSHEMLEKALALLQSGESRSLPVVHDGRLVGMLTPENVAEFMAIETALLSHAQRLAREKRPAKV